LSSEVSSFSHNKGRLSALHRHFHGVQLGMNTPISIYFSQLGQFLQILGISASVITAPLQRVVFDYVFNHRPEHGKKHYGRNNQQCRYTKIRPRIALQFV
jgi:hypothetical protein